MECSLDTYILNEQGNPLKSTRISYPGISLSLTKTGMLIEIPVGNTPIQQVNSLREKIKGIIEHKFKSLVGNFERGQDKNVLNLRYSFTPQYIEQARQKLKILNETKARINEDLKELNTPIKNRNLRPINYKPSYSPFGTDYEKSEAALQEQQDREDRLEGEIDTTSIQSKIQSVENINNSLDLVFQINPEFSNIGTKEEYSRYLETIFPESKDKSVWYSTKDPNRFISMPSLQEMFISNNFENPYEPYIVNVSKEDKVQNTLIGKQLELSFNENTLFKLGTSEDLEKFSKFVDKSENRTNSFVAESINPEEVKLNYLLYRSNEEMTDEQAEELLKQCGI